MFYAGVQSLSTATMIVCVIDQSSVTHWLAERLLKHSHNGGQAELVLRSSLGATLYELTQNVMH